MSMYHYSPLSRGSDRVRLLRLTPPEGEPSPLQCQLVEYSLADPNITHQYEALSYVWGDPKKTLPISVNGHRFTITTNLHTALLRLRECGIELVWVDAICIDQRDSQERAHQVRYMAKIYGKAKRVIVWLGEAADDSGRVLEEMHTHQKRPNVSGNTSIQHAVLALLERPWFRRVWVLQEVAAARHILIMCGPAEIEGYAFCVGMKSRQVFCEARPDLQNLIRSVTYLIRQARFRPTHGISWSDMSFLAIRPLGELLDMFHKHEASERHDKVYALLGMSTDANDDAKLLPDYTAPWGEVLRRLVDFLLPGQISVETSDDREMALVKSRACFLGRVISITPHSGWDDTQKVELELKGTSITLRDMTDWREVWTLNTSAKPIRQGDLLCLLPGTSNPMIVRISEWHFEIIMITVTHPEYTRTASGRVKWRTLLRSAKFSQHGCRFVWDWEKANICPLGQQKRNTLLDTTNLGGLEHSPTALKDLVDKTSDMWKIGLMLEDFDEFENASEMFQAALDDCERSLGKGCLLTTRSRNEFVWIYKQQRREKGMEKLFTQGNHEIQMEVSPDTIEIITEHSFSDGSKWHLIETKDLHLVAFILNHEGEGDTDTMQGVNKVGKTLRTRKTVMMSLLKSGETNIRVSEEMVIHVAKVFDMEVITVFLDGKRHDISVQELVVDKIARFFDKEVMMLLLDRSINGVTITERIVEAVANSGDRKEVTKLLLSHKGTDVSFTEAMVAKIARSFGEEMMLLLLDRRKSDIPITKSVVEAARANSRHGKKVMKLLLSQEGNQISLTEAAVHQIVMFFDAEVLRLLLALRGDNVPSITGSIFELVAGNSDNGIKLMTDLLEQAADVPFTRRTVSNAAMNLLDAEAMVKLVLDQRGDNIRITKDVLMTAVQSPSVKGVIEILFDEKGDMTTEEIFKAAAGIRIERRVKWMLLDQKGGAVRIAEDMLKAAAGSIKGGRIIELLLDRKGVKIQITEGILKATEKNPSSGEKVRALLLKHRDDNVASTAAGHQSSRMDATLERKRTGNELTEE